MAKFDDSITINCSLLEVRDLLADLQRHPSYVPDGFKNYRFLSRETRGPGARAAVQLNLLGHWLGGELEVAEATDKHVVLKASVEVANLELDFHLVERGGRTEVRMSSSFQRRSLPPWRLRTRIKQRLRLEQDVGNLVGRFLSLLKGVAEVSPTAEAGSSIDAKARAGEGAGAGKAAAKPAAGAGAKSAEAKPAAKSGAAKPAAKSEAKSASSSEAARTPAKADTAKADTAKAAAKSAPAKAEPVPDSAGAEGKSAAKTAPRTAAKAAAESKAAPAVAATDDYVPAGSESDLGPGQARVIKVGDRDVAVFNIAGEFYAISNTCPHRGGPLGFGTLDGSVVTCPLHGFRFDVSTGQCPDVESLKVARFELRRSDGQLQVRSAPIPA